MTKAEIGRLEQVMLKLKENLDRANSLYSHLEAEVAILKKTSRKSGTKRARKNSR